MLNLPFDEKHKEANSRSEYLPYNLKLETNVNKNRHLYTTVFWLRLPLQRT